MDRLPQRLAHRVPVLAHGASADGLPEDCGGAQDIWLGLLYNVDSVLDERGSLDSAGNKWRGLGGEFEIIFNSAC